MDKNIVYYLSHPFGTFGNKEENVTKSKQIAAVLRGNGFKVINPIAILNEHDDSIAMRKCKELYEVCNGIIMCPDYSHSVGCIKERYWAIKDNKAIAFVNRKGELIIDYDPEEIKLL